MANIQLSGLTNSTNVDNGTGVFDVLMTAIELRIERQFVQGRITSDDYAVVYLGAIQSTLADSIKFILSEEIAGLEADLLAEKVSSEVKNNEVGGVIDLQKIGLQAETAIKTQQVLTEIETTLLTKEKGESEELANKPDGLIQAQIVKTNSENLLLLKKGDTEVQQTAKTTAEKNLLDQKTRTEESEITDVVAGAAVTGTVGEKKRLFSAQTAGFARDAEQKLSKIMVDTWNVAKTADPTGVSGNTQNSLTDRDIGQVIDKAKAGIGT